MGRDNNPRLELEIAWPFAFGQAWVRQQRIPAWMRFLLSCTLPRAGRNARKAARQRRRQHRRRSAALAAGRN